MKNLLIAILFIIIMSGCSTKMTFPVLSEKIYRKNGGVKDKSTFKLSIYKKEARTKALLLDSSAFLKGALKDTIYILEGYNIETATFYGTIWDKKNSVSYNYLKGNLTLQKQPVFTDYQVKLITHWDTSAVRKEEKINGNWLDNNLQIDALRCYKNGKDWQIDEIEFKNFYDPKRDK